MRDSKALLRLWRLHLEAHPPVSPIAKIEMTAEPAQTRFAQTGLFSPLSPDPEKLEITMARMRHLSAKRTSARREPVDTHRPLSFAMRHFDPAAVAEDFDGRSPRELASRPLQCCCSDDRSARVSARDAGASGSSRGVCPVRIFFGGVWGEVMAASGPWRNVGRLVDGGSLESG